MNEPIRHIAGPYEDGVQQCVRCLRILVDNRLYLHSGYEDSLRLGFREGVPLCFDYDNNKCWHEDTYDSCDPIQAVNCTPMEAGL